MFQGPCPVPVVDVGLDGLTVQLPSCRPRVKYDEVVKVVPAALVAAGAALPCPPPGSPSVQQEPTLNCGGRRQDGVEGAKGGASPANTSNPHQDGASSRSQTEGGAGRCSGGALDDGRPTAGGSSSGSVSCAAATNEVQVGRGATRVVWGEERSSGTPRAKRKRAATAVHGREEAAPSLSQHVRSDQTQIDPVRPSLISACVDDGSGVGAQGSAGGGAEGQRSGRGWCAAVGARGRGDPEARVTLGSALQGM